jgi:hypothetical protein
VPNLIDDGPRTRISYRLCGKTWMAGSSPAMTFGEIVPHVVIPDSAP